MIVFDKLWETMKAKHVSTYALRDRFDIDSRTSAGCGPINCHDGYAG